jgi:tagatose-1,6-bisphosphate aldolase
MLYVDRKEGGAAVKIIVHYPRTSEKQSQLDKLVAKFHAEYVAQYIEKLNCSVEQKMKLLDAVAEAVTDASIENSKKYI